MILLKGVDVMASDKTVLNVRYDPTVYEKIRLIAEQENRSMSNLVEYWSLIFIADYEGENGTIEFGEGSPIAAHRKDNPTKNLPDDALKSVAEAKAAYRMKRTKNN